MVEPEALGVGVGERVERVAGGGAVDGAQPLGLADEAVERGRLARGHGGDRARSDGDGVAALRQVGQHLHRALAAARAEHVADLGGAGAGRVRLDDRLEQRRRRRAADERLRLGARAPEPVGERADDRGDARRRHALGQPLAHLVGQELRRQPGARGAVEDPVDRGGRRAEARVVGRRPVGPGHAAGEQHHDDDPAPHRPIVRANRAADAPHGTSTIAFLPPKPSSTNPPAWGGVTIAPSMLSAQA